MQSQKRTERRLGEPVSNLNGLGEPASKRGWANQYLKTNPPGPVGRTIEKKNPKPLPGPLGRPLKNETPDPLGEQKGATQKSLQKTHKILSTSDSVLAQHLLLSACSAPPALGALRPPAPGPLRRANSAGAPRLPAGSQKRQRSKLPGSHSTSTSTLHSSAP